MNGFLAALTAAACYGLWAIGMSKMGQSGWDKTWLLSMSMIISAILSAGFAFATVGAPTGVLALSSIGWVSLVGLMAIVGNYSFIKATQLGTPTAVATAISATYPVFTLLIAMSLGEAVTVKQVTGIIMVVIGVVLLSG